MKALRTSLLVLILFSLTTIAVRYGQTSSFFQGIDYAAAGKFEEAHREFTKSLELDPGFVDAKRCWEICEDVLKERIKADTANHLFSGITYKLAAKHHMAIPEFKKALEIDPNYARTHFHLGLAYSRKGEYGQAIAAHRKAVEIDPDYAEAHIALGLAYWRSGMLDEAISTYEKVLELDPNLNFMHYFLAALYYRKGEYSRAIEHYDRATELEVYDVLGLGEELEPYRQK